MTETHTPPTVPTGTVFLNGQQWAHGSYAELNRALAQRSPSDESVLVFDDASGALLDRPLPEPVPTAAPTPAATEAETGDDTAAAPSVGRPRLGVVAREVTLLPRHWQWLASQRGGASAALRRLVDEARRNHAQADAQRLARERAYRCMSALAAQQAGFEDASRALFAGDAAAFAQHTAAWPADVRAYLQRLAQGGFGDNTATPPT